MKSRVPLPTVNVPQNRIAMLEGACWPWPATGATWSLHSISTSAHFTSSKFLRSRWGSSVGLKSGDPRDYEDAIDERVKFIWIESISNPGNVVPDFEDLSRVGQQAKVRLIVSWCLHLRNKEQGELFASGASLKSSGIWKAHSVRPQRNNFCRTRVAGHSMWKACPKGIPGTQRVWQIGCGISPGSIGSTISAIRIIRITNEPPDISYEDLVLCQFTALGIQRP